MTKCPLTKKNCLKDKCAWWIKLTADKQEQGRCAIAWIPILMVELRGAVEYNKANEIFKARR